MRNMNTRIRQPPTDENRIEAQTLHALWRSNKARRKEIGVYTQADIGARYGIGHQSTVAAYLTGKAAMGLKAAQGFALAFNCKVSDFSPRLAGELEVIRSAAARTEGNSLHEIGPEGVMLAREFERMPDDTTEQEAKRDTLFANLMALIAVALRDQSCIDAPSPPSAPTAARPAQTKKQLSEPRKP